MSANKENRPIAIDVSGVKKMYKLGQIGGGTLQRDLQSWWARKRGKEDPNSKIGEGERSHGATFMALNGIDLTIYQGEAVGIIGSNGAGKSTLLKLLSRVTAPTEGEIDIYGRIASMLEVGTGFNQELTGRENVYMNGAILGMTKAEIDAKMEEIIEFSEVREFIDTPVKRYSSGMFVKLAFSVAAHLDAEIMIMDEVLAVGDMAFQKKCLTKMREAAKQDGRTVLYVSHNMNTIRQLCDRCIVLNKGKVIFEGDVEKAVQVYMGGSSELNHNIIIQPYMRVIDCDSKIRVTSFISSNEDCILPFGNKLSFRLVICSKYDIDKKCYLRAIIHSANGDAVAMCHSNEPIVVNRNADSVHEFEMDISQIVPGDYYLDLVLIDFGDLGAEIRLDSLQYVFRFRISETPDFNLCKTWYSAGWGYFCINCHVLHMENM